MAKTTHVRLTPEAASVANGLAGDSILVLAGLGPLNRSQVVTLACHLLSLVANDLAETGEDGDPRMVSPTWCLSGCWTCSTTVGSRIKTPETPETRTACGSAS